MGLQVKLSTVVCLLLLLCVGELEGAYKSYWANKTLPVVEKNRCGKVTSQDKAWDTHPATYACEDDIGSDNCMPFVEGGVAIYKDPANAKRSTLCDEPYFQDAANRCRKTCGTCCEHEKYACADTTASFECKSIAGTPIPDNANKGQFKLGPNLCGIKALYDILVDACAKSCGFCVLKKAKEATPKAPTTDPTPKSKKPPIDPKRLQIPKKKGCKDTPPKKSKSGFCERRMYRCEEEKHLKDMKNHCKQTCAFAFHQISSVLTRTRKSHYEKGPRKCEKCQASLAFSMCALEKEQLLPEWRLPSLSQTLPLC